MQPDHPTLAVLSGPWNHQSAFASLKVNAKRVAGLENARALILQSRQIRYLRFAQLTHQQVGDMRTEEPPDA